MDNALCTPKTQCTWCLTMCRKKRKEKFTLFSDHHGSLPRRQPGAPRQCADMRGPLWSQHWQGRLLWKTSRYGILLIRDVRKRMCKAGPAMCYASAQRCLQLITSLHVVCHYTHSKTVVLAKQASTTLTTRSNVRQHTRQWKKVQTALGRRVTHGKAGSPMTDNYFYFIIIIIYYYYNYYYYCYYYYYRCCCCCW